MTQTSIAHADQAYVMAGIGGGPSDLWSWQGIAYAPLADLGDSGPILRAWLRGYRFDYRTDLPGADDVRIEAAGIGGDFEAGWQLAAADWRVAGFLGAAWRDYALSPADPSSSLAANRLGLSATFDGEVRFGPGLGVLANASYVTGYRQYWAQLRPFATLGDGWKLGPEIAVAGGADYTHLRAGAFLSGYELDLPWLGRLYLGADAGARLDLRDGGLHPYAGLNVGRLF